MTTETDKYRWTFQRVLIALWFAGFAGLIVVMAYPVNVGILRLFVAVAIPGLWLLGVFLVRRVKWQAWSLLVLGMLIIGFGVLPGKTMDPPRLRTEFLKQLKRYDGTPYVWGGENRRGIDCSGLMRRALVNSYFRLACTTASPQALRAGLDLWWHDCSAKALRDQYRDFTVPVFSAPSINSITNTILTPGDMAVTWDGIHVLAYLGDRRWIEADPGLGSVIQVPVPTDNTWFTVPVQIMRWTALKGTSSTAFQRKP